MGNPQSFQEAIFPIEKVLGQSSSEEEPPEQEQSTLFPLPFSPSSVRLVNKLGENGFTYKIKSKSESEVVLVFSKDSGEFLGTFKSDKSEKDREIICTLSFSYDSWRYIGKEVLSIIRKSGYSYLISYRTSEIYVYVYVPTKIKCPNAWVCVDNKTGYVKFFDVPEGESFFDLFPVDEFNEEEIADIMRYVRKDDDKNTAIHDLIIGLAEDSKRHWFIISNYLADKGIIVIYGQNLWTFEGNCRDFFLPFMQILSKNNCYGASFVMIDNYSAIGGHFPVFTSSTIIKQAGNISLKDCLCSVYLGENYPPKLFENQDGYLSLQEAIFPSKKASEYSKSSEKRKAPEQEKQTVLFTGSSSLSSEILINNLLDNGFTYEVRREGPGLLILTFTKNSDEFTGYFKGKQSTDEILHCIFSIPPDTWERIGDEITSIIKKSGYTYFTPSEAGTGIQLNVFHQRRIKSPNAWVCVDWRTGYVKFFDVPEGESFFDWFPADELDEEELANVMRYVDKNRAMLSLLESLNRYSIGKIWFVISNCLEDKGIIVIYSMDKRDEESIEYKKGFLSLMQVLYNNRCYYALFVAIRSFSLFGNLFFVLPASTIMAREGNISLKNDAFAEYTETEYPPDLCENQDSHLSLQEAVLPPEREHQFLGFSSKEKEEEEDPNQLLLLPERTCKSRLRRELIYRLKKYGFSYRITSEERLRPVAEFRLGSACFDFIPWKENKKGDDGIICTLSFSYDSWASLSAIVASILKEMGLSFFYNELNTVDMYVFPRNKIDCPNVWVHVDKESGYVKFYDVPEGDSFFERFPVDTFNDEEKKVLEDTFKKKQDKDILTIYAGLERINKKHEWFTISSHLAEEGIIVIYGNDFFEVRTNFNTFALPLLQTLQKNNYYGASFAAICDAFYSRLFYIYPVYRIAERNGDIHIEDSICAAHYKYFGSGLGYSPVVGFMKDQGISPSHTV